MKHYPRKNENGDSATNQQYTNGFQATSALTRRRT